MYICVCICAVVLFEMVAIFVALQHLCNTFIPKHFVLAFLFEYSLGELFYGSIPQRHQLRLPL